jgi:hypothetical protein
MYGIITTNALFKAYEKKPTMSLKLRNRSKEIERGQLTIGQAIKITVMS